MCPVPVPPRNVVNRRASVYVVALGGEWCFACGLAVVAMRALAVSSDCVVALRHVMLTSTFVVAVSSSKFRCVVLLDVVLQSA